MNKDLEALDELKDILKTVDLEDIREIDIIETALKDLLWYKEQLKDFDIKENQLRETFIVYKNYQADQNKLKALEIIKETQVNIFTVIHSKNYEDFRKKCFDVNCLYLRFPTQEEYDLLKEELE